MLDAFGYLESGIAYSLPPDIGAIARQFANAWKAAEVVVSAQPQSMVLRSRIESLVLALSNFRVAVNRIAAERPRKPGRGGQPRTGYPLHDEYDVQDALWLFLKMAYPLAKDEAPTEKLAGSHSNIDFVIPELRLALEVKVVRVGDDVRNLKKQLLQDIADVEAEERWTTLVLFLAEVPGASGVAEPLEELRQPNAKLVVSVVRVQL